VRQIIAMGGVLTQEDVSLFPYVVDQARRSKPRVGFLPTASGDAESFIAKFYKHFSGLPCEGTVPASHALARKRALQGPRMIGLRSFGT
jgi:peptidase E